MKTYTRLTSLFLFLIPFCYSCNAQDETKPISYSTPLYLADPFILLHNNTYYAYGTNADEGIEVYTSDDLLTWRKNTELALHKNDSWGEKWFWAPEVYHINGKFYMYYTADEHICVATANSALGPFVQDNKEPMIKGEKCIDNSLFIDDDGTAYIYFDRFNDGLNIWVAELQNDLKTIKAETMTKCINVSQPWEEIWPRVNEGAFVIKHNTTYYMTYSANSYESPFYGIGFATSSSPKGPWVKYLYNPILSRPNNNTLVGVGHSAIFKDKQGNLKIVFHAHHDEKNIHPRIMYITDLTFNDNEDPSIIKISEDKIIQPKVKF